MHHQSNSRGIYAVITVTVTDTFTVTHFLFILLLDSNITTGLQNYHLLFVAEPVICKDNANWIKQSMTKQIRQNDNDQDFVELKSMCVN